MQIRCLVADPNPSTRNQLVSTVQKLLKLAPKSAGSVYEATKAMESQYCKLILARFGHPELDGEAFLKMVKEMHVRVAIIAIIDKPDPVLLKRILSSRAGVVDILTEGAPEERFQAAFQKALGRITDTAGAERPSYYRGFFGFVGLVPSLRERKLLTDAGLGLTQNSSLRLAIDYWNNTPGCRLVGVCFNMNETFSSAEDTPEECEETDLRPWEYGMSEAQNHYLDYWQDPIRDGLMPVAIPTIVRRGINDLTPVPAEAQKQVLVKVRELTRQGNLDETLRSMGIRTRIEHSTMQSQRFDESIQKLDKQMKKVDEHYPQLTRPPTETGWENFQPDVAEQSHEKQAGMAFMQKRR